MSEFHGQPEPNTYRTADQVPPDSVVGNSPFSPFYGQTPATAPHKAPKKRGWLPWAVAVLAFFLGIAIGGAGGDSDASSAAPGATKTVTAPPVTKTVTRPGPTVKVTETQKPAEAAAAITGDGTYEVGVDVQPGKYKSAGGEGCYWARRSSLDGSLGSIIANSLSDGPQTVTIKRSDKAFETSNCGEWRKAG